MSTPTTRGRRPGRSALELAEALITAGVGLVYWYGYDRPADRGWAFADVSARAPTASLWSGDMMFTADTGNLDGGHFGTATTPGTGCGVVCANISQQAIQAAQRLGDGWQLPTPAPGCRMAPGAASTSPCEPSKTPADI